MSNYSNILIVLRRINFSDLESSPSAVRSSSMPWPWHGRFVRVSPGPGDQAHQICTASSFPLASLTNSLNLPRERHLIPANRQRDTKMVNGSFMKESLINGSASLLTMSPLLFVYEHADRQTKSQCERVSHSSHQTPVVHNTWTRVTLRLVKVTLCIRYPIIQRVYMKHSDIPRA